MTNFYEQIQAEQRDYSELDSEDLSEAESNARARMYDEIQGLQGAYHLWENGHVEGDAGDAEMIADGAIFGLEIDIEDEDSKTKLFEKLDEEFLGRYHEELQKLLDRKNLQLEVIEIFWNNDSSELMDLPEAKVVTCGSEGMEVLGTAQEIAKLKSYVEENPNNLTLGSWRDAEESDLLEAVRMNKDSFPEFSGVDDLKDYLVKQ